MIDISLFQEFEVGTVFPHIAITSRGQILFNQGFCRKYKADMNSHMRLFFDDCHGVIAVRFSTEGVKVSTVGSAYKGCTSTKFFKRFALDVKTFVGKYAVERHTNDNGDVIFTINLMEGGVE